MTNSTTDAASNQPKTEQYVILAGCDDDCPLCSGEACDFCGAGCWNYEVRDCNHDVIERHKVPDEK